MVTSRDFHPAGRQGEHVSSAAVALYMCRYVYNIVVALKNNNNFILDIPKIHASGRPETNVFFWSGLIGYIV